LKTANRHFRARRRNRLLASERMTILLNLSKETLKTKPERAQHYFQLARKLGMRYKVRLPREYRGLICRHCKKLIVPGINARVRVQQLREPHVVITCLECGGQKRVPLRSREDSDD
jgi:ribonuclease P protein subunit RPR2